MLFKLKLKPFAPRIQIRINSFDNLAKDPLDEWIYFLKNEKIEDTFKAKGLQKAKEQLDMLKLPEDERLAYNRYVDNLHYQASMVESSYGVGKLKGRKEGEKIGEERGRLYVAIICWMYWRDIMRKVKRRDLTFLFFNMHLR